LRALLETKLRAFVPLRLGVKKINRATAIKSALYKKIKLRIK
jgi:hypothetical protein